MKYIKRGFAITLACTICICGAKNSPTADGENTENKSVKSHTIAHSQDYADLIRKVYAQFVFTTDADPEIYAYPEQFFTSSALQKLQNCYEFDCENGDCYAYYALRTQEQDSRPGTNGESYITDIERLGDDSYIVKYTDMGWAGITRIKIVDGKIDDFERCGCAEDL